MDVASKTSLNLNHDYLSMQTSNYETQAINKSISASLQNPKSNQREDE